jgi:outer membrane protein insertion porin family
MYNKIFCVFLIILLTSAFVTGLAAEPDNSGKLVTDVRVKNNNLVSTSTVLSKVKTDTGVRFTQKGLNEDIKALYNTGYFTDIKVDLEDYQGGVAVIFIVEEKPLVENITLKGNKRIRDARLEEFIEIETGQPLDHTKLKETVNKIEDFYIKEGYHKALVEEEVQVDKKANKARVFILINEDKRYRIKRINIEGNTALSDKKILESIRTKPDKLFTSGFFDEKIMENDIKRIERIYEDKGYLDTKADYNLAYNEENETIVIDIKIEVGKIEIKGNEPIKNEKIKEILAMTEDSTFIRAELRDDTMRINELYFDRGYIAADVRPEVVFNSETGKMDITYDISSGKQATIEKIKIRGNTKTKDIVIRRELEITPGEIFDGEKLKESRQNLNNLGYFEEINFDTISGTAPDKKDLIIDVKETKTGEVSFGAGYSSIDNFIGFVELRQRNFDWRNFPTFTGDGQKLSIRTEFGSERKYYDLSFTEPWVFNKPISFGFDIYKRYRDWDTYDLERTGGDLRLGKRFDDHLSLDSMYKIEEVTVSDVADNASTDVTREEGDSTLSTFSLTLTRDTRNNVYNPTEGGIIKNGVEFAGGPFGGDKDFIKYTSMLDWYFRYFENCVFEVKLEAGVVGEYGDSDVVPIYERFYAGGGNSIRGYDYREVGPMSAAHNPIGGKSMAVANFEYTFPIVKQLRGAVFYDVGNVWEDVSDFGDEFKSGVGVGVRVKTPLGPVKVDWGYGLDHEPGESKSKFHFSMSRGF